MKLPGRKTRLVGAGFIGMIVVVYSAVTLILEMPSPDRERILYLALLFFALVFTGLILGSVGRWYQARLKRSYIDITAARATETALRVQVQALQTIAEIEQALNSTANLSERMARLLQRAAAYLKADLGSVGLVDPATHMIQLIAQHGARQPDTWLATPMRVGQGAAGWVAAHGAPLAIFDVAHDPRWERTTAADAEGICSYLGIPLCVEARPIGVIDFMTRAPRQFTPAEIDFVTMLASRTVTRIQNAHSMESARAELALAQTLQEIGKLLTSELNLDQVLDTILDLLGHVIAYDTVSIQLLQENGMLELVAGRGFANMERARQIVREILSPTQYAEYAIGQAVVISDTYTDPRWSKLAGAEYIRSWIGAPLIVKGKLIGVLTVDSKTVNTYTTAIGKTTMAFADQAAIAIANARLNEQSQQRATQLSTLNEIGRAVSSLSDLEGTLEIIYQQVQRILPLDVFFIALYNAQTGALSYPLLYDAGKRYTKTVETLTPESYVAKAIQKGQIQLFNRSAEELATFTPSLMLGDTTRVSASLLFASLQIGARNIGAISAQSYQRNAYTQEHVRLLTDIGQQAAIAIENARLFSAQQHRAMELEALRQASLRLTSSLDLDAVLNAVLENILRLSNEAQNAHIYLYENQRLSFGAALWSSGQRGKEFAMPREDGLTYSVARQGKMILVPDMTQHPLFAHQPHDQWRGAIVGLPLLAGEKTLGVLNVAFAKPRAFEPAEIDTLQLFADQAAIAIANARLHQDVQASELRYRSLIENLPIAVYRVTPGPQGKFLLANPAHLALFGFESLAKLQRINVVDLYMDPHQRLGFSNQVREKGKVSALEQYLKKKDGTPIWVQVTAQAVYQDDQIVYFDCTALDITERKRESLARANAEETLKQRTRELEAMLEVSSSSTYLDLETVLNVVANRARDLLNATEATIFLMDEQENLLRPVVALGEYTSERLSLALHPGEGLVGWVAQHRQALVIDHAATDARIKHVPGTPEEDESLMCAPLIHGTHLQGVVLLNRIPPVGFTQTELSWLVGLAAQASGAVANARLFEETRQNALEQKIVSEISRALNATLDVYETFPEVVRGIRALADCDRVSLALLDATFENFTMVMLDAPHPELSQGTQMSVKDTACAADVLARREHITPDLRAEIDFAGERALYDAGYRSRVNLPLIAGERILGSLNLVSQRVGAFDHAPLAPLLQIANTVAIALENTQLFQAEQTRREELTALYELSRQLADLTSDEAVLTLVARHIVDSTRVTFARLALIEGEELVIRAGYLIRPLEHDLKIGQREALHRLPALQEILRVSAPTVIQRDDPQIGPLEAEALFLGIGQTLCLVPLYVRDQVIGLLMLGEERSHGRATFTPEKIRLARNIGDQAASALHRIGLFEELEGAYLQTVFALANAVDAKDSDTHQHSQRLADLALLIGKKIGLSARVLEDLRYGAILHDIGKIGVPDAVLKKPATLNVTDWELMHQHPVIGEHILAPLPHLANSAKIVRHHHERYDGSGYPDHLAREQIPIGARILAVVDAYGAIIDRRVYKDEQSHEQAIAEILNCTGSQFDPQIVDIFLQIMAERPA